MTVSAASRPVIDLTDDESTAARSTSIRIGLLWVLAWSSVVVAMAALVSAQKGVPLRYTIVSEAVNYYALALVSLIVWFASAAIMSRQWSWSTQAAVHAVVGVGLVASWQTIYLVYLRSAMGADPWKLLVRTTWMFQLVNACVLYAGIVGGTIALHTARRARMQERRQHELTLLAREAELRALTTQLEPHFLVNSLNSVMALIETSPCDARAMLERLADLLNAAFDEMQESAVTLARELDLVTAYLAIEQVRFRDRLTVSVDVPDELKAVAVPPFLLQPIVENAIKHAVAPSSHGAAITIRGRRDGTRISIDVADSGVGFQDARSSHGRGLELTQRRLRAFAPDGQLHVDRGTSGCTVSVIFSG